MRWYPDARLVARARHLAISRIGDLAVAESGDLVIYLVIWRLDP
jgi:hypothetical protein